MGRVVQRPSRFATFARTIPTPAGGTRVQDVRAQRAFSLLKIASPRLAAAAALLVAGALSHDAAAQGRGGSGGTGSGASSGVGGG